MNMKLSTVGCLGILALTLAGCGKEESNTPQMQMPADTVPASQPATSQPQAKFDNTLCPVGKHPISGKGVAVDYKGKSYGFCCDDCAPLFKADPEKYLASNE
jgi:YHS domain-containing protein